MTIINFLLDGIRQRLPAFTTKLPHVTTYTRELPISLERMYENAIDGEHLPWLHSSSFSKLEILDQGKWGWRARGNLQPYSFMNAMVLELKLDRDKNRWITRTLSGLGKGTEIWTHAIPINENRIKVIVDVFVPKFPRFLKPLYAKQYLETYAHLYDEDLWMMATRQNELNRVKEGKAIERSDSINLGTLGHIKKQLPKAFDFNGHPFRLISLDDALVAHSATCPHMLGPLNDIDVARGTVACPWHGYEFDVKTRDCISGQKCKLAPAPSIHIEGPLQNVIARVIHS
jgi:nitrite reductase (NADH) small subunit